MIDIFGTLFFGLAILHTFLVGFFHKQAEKHHQGSVAHGIFHFLGEIEVVFGIWATVFFVFFVFLKDWNSAIQYIDSLRFTEPLFVFAIMVIASTRPILESARGFIRLCSTGIQRVIPLEPQIMDIFILLILGPLSGSLITEPAAITVTALLLKDMVNTSSERMTYALLAFLFVNISIGGALTPFAAPPILMVAKPWGWDFEFTMVHFGWKSVSAVFVNSALFTWYFRREIRSGVSSLSELAKKHSSFRIPLGVIFVHYIFLVLLILTSHHPNVFIALLMLFLGVVTVTKSYQQPLRLKESLLVAFFLAGIIVFGPFQRWWLQPVLQTLSDGTLFWSATLLTAFTDNAALTFLGTQVSGLSDTSKYALVAGAIAGGGLTVIANAPNAAGYSILNSKISGGGMSPLRLLIAALLPTLVACFFLFLLPILH